MDEKNPLSQGGMLSRLPISPNEGGRELIVHGPIGTITIGPSYQAERLREIADWLENEAEERIKWANARRDSARTMRNATAAELRSAKATAEKMAGHKFHGGISSEKSAKQGADMDDRIASKLETEARQLSAWAEVLRSMTGKPGPSTAR